MNELGDTRVLVTGGAGFLGSHLCERLLESGADVLCVDNFSTGSKRLLMRSRVELAGPVNLGNPEEHTILELAQMTIALTRSRSPIVFKELPYDDPVRRRPDISLATAELGWRPRVPLAEGLERTIDYFDGLIAAAREPAEGRARWAS